MKSYQDFVTTLAAIRRMKEQEGYEALDHHYKTGKKTYYKKIGLKDEDAIKQMERRKSKQMDDRLDLAMELVQEYGSIYKLSDIVRRYVLLNHPPSDRSIIQKLALPFKATFIDAEFTREDVDLGVDNIKGVLILETPAVEEKDGNRRGKELGRVFTVYYVCHEEEKVFIDEFFLDVDKKLNLKIWHDDRKTAKFLTDFVINFLLFINDPEVEWVEHRRDAKNAQRRARQGKMPLPNNREVRLVGKLKKYVDGIKEHLGGGKYNYRFWVRGHTRTLRSDRYTKMKGQVIRIEPFMKGEGVLLKRTYSLDMEKKDRRAQEIRKGNLFYEDI